MRADVLQRSYDRFATRYDQIFRPQQAPKIHGLLAPLPEPLPTPILDLGAGTGLFGRLTGLDCVQVDLSRDMLRHARGLCVQANMRRLPFGAQAFGTIFAVTSLIDFVDPRPTIDEMVRVLRPSGLLALSVLKIEDLAAVERALEAHDLQILERLDLEQDLGFVCQAL